MIGTEHPMVYICMPSQSQILTSSYEQLWLAFIMRKKYNKFWDGKEWRKDDEQ